MLALDQLPLMVAWLDERQCLSYANPAWLAWFDHTDLEQAQGQPLHAICGQPWMLRHSASFATAASGGKCSFDIEKYDVFDVVRWARVHLSSAHTGHFRPGLPTPAMLMVMQDSTGERARDDIIAKQRELLHQGRVKQTAERQMLDELQKTRTLLDWRTVMLTERNEMLQLLSHEIRQPLNNASAAMQATTKAIAALKLPDVDPASAALLRAEHVLQQVIGTLDNTLAAATVLSDGGDVSTPSEADLPMLIKLVLHDIAADVRSRIDVVWETDTRTVQLHPTLMRLAVRNLLNRSVLFAARSARDPRHFRNRQPAGHLHRGARPGAGHSGAAARQGIREGHARQQLPPPPGRRARAVHRAQHHEAASRYSRGSGQRTLRHHHAADAAPGAGRLNHTTHRD